nr:MAG TPA: DNA-directed RNA polymerase II subunit [Caudoviricetes sp.]
MKTARNQARMSPNVLKRISQKIHLNRLVLSEVFEQREINTILKLVQEKNEERDRPKDVWRVDETTGAMWCPNCGRMHGVNNTSFCGNCGAQLGKGVES